MSKLIESFVDDLKREFPIVRHDENDVPTDDGVFRIVTLFLGGEDKKAVLEWLSKYAKFFRIFSIDTGSEHGDIDVWLKESKIIETDMTGKAAETGIMPADVDSEELRMGIEVEYEHTKDRDLAKKIALDHLAEFERYYSRLAQMELDSKEAGETVESNRSLAVSLIDNDFNEENVTTTANIAVPPNSAGMVKAIPINTQSCPNCGVTVSDKLRKQVKNCPTCGKRW